MPEVEVDGVRVRSGFVRPAVCPLQSGFEQRHNETTQNSRNTVRATQRDCHNSAKSGQRKITIPENSRNCRGVHNDNYETVMRTVRASLRGCMKTLRRESEHFWCSHETTKMKKRPFIPAPRPATIVRRASLTNLASAWECVVVCELRCCWTWCASGFPGPISWCATGFSEPTLGPELGQDVFLEYSQ